MKTSFTKKQISLTISCVLTLGFVSGVANAQMNPADTGYLGDQRGTIVRSGFGLCWHTGTGPAAAKPNECEGGVAPLAQNTAPTPRPAATITRVTIDADALFDFDKAVLRPAGRVTLDEFVTKLKTMNPETVAVIGHTDRMGSAAYNQKLSERRAASVKSYLVAKGIEPSRISSEGKGETESAMKTTDCVDGNRAKRIVCLQPDRRVDIEVKGTQATK